MGNDIPEDIGPLSLSMVLLKRTGGEETGNTTLTAGLGYAIVLGVRHPVFTYIICYRT